MIASPETMLRQSYQRARALDVEQQLRECVDHLENPDVLVAELADAYCAIDSCYDPPDLPVEPETPAEEDDADELLLEHFYPSRIIEVHANPAWSFTSLASELDLLCPGAPGGARSGGVDFVGIRETTALLGVVESFVESSPYALLLRALACVSEFLPPAQAERLDERYWKGALGGTPPIELCLVECKEPAAPRSEALAELTRDLAGSVLDALAFEPQLPSRLLAIRCLRMDTEAFDGSLEPVWQLDAS